MHPRKDKAVVPADPNISDVIRAMAWLSNAFNKGTLGEKAAEHSGKLSYLLINLKSSIQARDDLQAKLLLSNSPAAHHLLRMAGLQPPNEIGEAPEGSQDAEEFDRELAGFLEEQQAKGRDLQGIIDELKQEGVIDVSQA